MSDRPTVIQLQGGGPGCAVTLLYFVLIGWWLSGLWAVIAYLFNVTIIGMPLGIMMLNMLPRVATLREPTTVTVYSGGTLRRVGIVQRSFLLRALYFVFFGWWLSLIWIVAAWLLSVTVVGLPLAIWMYNRVPAVTTLARY